MNRRCMVRVSITLLCLAVSPSASAKLRMPEVFSDHMVLQQDQPITVWGWADAGEKISVVLQATTLQTVAGPDGHWSVSFPAIRCDPVQGNPIRFEVRGVGETISYKDVLVGEVWLASGQSNMNRPVDATTMKTADYPRIRLFTSNGFIPRRNTLTDWVGWLPCSPQTIATCGDTIDKGKRRAFSEVAYHFARKLHLDLHVPIGIIHTSMGGTTAKDWTPRPDIERLYPFDKECGDARHKWGAVYQSRVAALVPFAIKGVLWYQGEDDGRNEHYGEDFKDLIDSWRKLWEQPQMPFYCVQIAQTTYSGGMLNVWAGQSWAVKNVANTGLIPTNDIYDNGPGHCRPGPTDGHTGWPIAGGSDPHPANKPLVAERLADAVLSKVYGLDRGEVFGPMVADCTISSNQLIVKFSYAGDGLVTNDGKAPNWFEISADGTAYGKAEARIIGPDRVSLSAAGIDKPKTVRFAWHALARHNLMNKKGLPAIPFGTVAP